MTSSRSRGQSPAPGLELAGLVRSALAGVKPVADVKMFGGIGFMLNGHRLVAASKRGLLLRVGTDRQSHALAKPGTRQMEMRGRPIAGYVYVDLPIRPAAVGGWVEMATDCVRTLQPKTRTKRRPTNRRGSTRHEAHANAYQNARWPNLAGVWLVSQISSTRVNSMP